MWRTIDMGSTEMSRWPTSTSASGAKAAALTRQVGVPPTAQVTCALVSPPPWYSYEKVW